MEFIKNTSLNTYVVFQFEVLDIGKLGCVQTGLDSELGGCLLWSSHKHQRKHKACNCEFHRLFHICVFYVL